jgi:hypothetical protein
MEERTASDADTSTSIMFHGDNTKFHVNLNSLVIRKIATGGRAQRRVSTGSA